MQLLTRRRALARLLLLGSAATHVRVARSEDDAPAPIRIRYYASVCAGISPNRAQAFTRPLVDDLSKHIEYNANVRHYPGATADDLMRLGRELNAGTVHLAAVWGIEYGWLKQQYPRLECMLLCDIGTDASSRLYVRRDSGISKINDLRNKIYVQFRDQPIMERLFLKKRLAQLNGTPMRFFGQELRRPTAKDAAWAVCHDQGQCMMICQAVFIRLREVQTSLEKQLVAIETSTTYPLPVLIGIPAYMNALHPTRPHLWDDFKKELRTIHKTRNGEIGVNFWRINGFINLPNDYEEKVHSAIATYPITLLEDASARP